MGISKRIKDDVFYLVNKYKTRNPFELADALGIIVVKAPLKGGLNGCYHEESGFQFIYVNPLSSLERDEKRLITNTNC